MSTRAGYPGVYIEGVPGNVQIIVGVSTSVTAFVGCTADGPTHKPVSVLSFGDFEREFGGLHRDSVLSYAVQSFFSNGGSQAWIVRVEDADCPAAIVGRRNDKTGIHALVCVDMWNILCLPGVTDRRAIEAAQQFCEERRAFLIVDPPEDVTTYAEAEAWVQDPANGPPRHRNAAVYFPRVVINDPLDGDRPRVVPPSGLMAGLYARTDDTQGVWKAPAGTGAVLRGVAKLECTLDDTQNRRLNELAVNCLRTFPPHKHVCWGARTLVGTDQHPSEWKYIPVRRLALFIEESLYRGTKWVVCEPNGERLWAQVRMSVGVFMHQLFRKGALQGSTPQEAYLVKCDHETTTQSDIDEGKVNILVGFAPLKAAEFVLIRISHTAKQPHT